MECISFELQFYLQLKIILRVPPWKGDLEQWACFTFGFGRSVKDGLLYFEELIILIFYHDYFDSSVFVAIKSQFIIIMNMDF